MLDQHESSSEYDPREMIPFAFPLFGGVFFLSVSPSSHGRIYLLIWDSGLEEVSSSFSEFLDWLRT